jgi:PAS domain S-box-containing protein
MTQTDSKTNILNDSEQKFRLLTELSSDWYWEQDSDYRFTSMGPQLHVVNLEPAELLIGKKRWNIPTLNLTQADWDTHREGLDKRLPFKDFEVQRIDPKGNIYWASLSGMPFFSEAGDFIGYRGIGRNITAKKRQEAQLRASEERFRSLTRLSSDWYWEQDAQFRFTGFEHADPSQVAGKTFTSTGKTRWETPALNLTDADWEAHRKTLRAHQPFFDFEIERTDLNGASRWIAISGEARFAADGTFIGYHGVGRDITKKKRLTAELLESQLQLKLVLAGSRDGAWDWNIEKNNFYASGRILEILGHKAQEVNLKHDDWMQQIAPQDRDAVHAVFENLARSQQTSFTTEFRMLKKDGEPVHVRDRGIVLRNSVGEVTRIAGTLTDLTQEHEAQAHMRLLHACMQSIKDVVIITLAEPLGMPGPQIVYVNDAFEKMTGYSRAEAIGNTPRMLQGAKTNRLELDRVSQALRSWQGIRTQLANYKKSGELFWIELEIIPVRMNGDGLYTHWIAIQRDITARVSAERAFKKTAERLEFTLQAAEIGSWTTNLSTGETQRDKRWYALLGQEPGTLSPRSSAWLSWLHPDDKTPLLIEQDRAVKDGVDSFENQYRMRHKSGDWVWIQSKARVVKRDKNGLPVVVTGTHMDITKAVNAQLLAAERQSQLAQCLECLPIGVYVSYQKKTLFVNTALVHMLGYDSAAPLMDKTIFDVIVQAEHEQVRTRTSHLKAGQEVPSLWLHLKALDGSIIHALVDTKIVPWGDQQHFLTTVSSSGDAQLLASEIDATRKRYAHLLVSQLEEKQNFIAGELHDSLGSQLLGISLQVASLATVQRSDKLFTASIDKLLLNIKTAAEITRTLAHGLVPVDTWPGSFWRALERLCADYQAKSVLRCEFEMSGDFEVVPAETGNHLYRICQEAIANAIRHGGATHITVTLSRTGYDALLCIADDGVGFEPHALAALCQKGVGLSSIQARARAIHGDVTFARIQPHGLSVGVTWQIPFRKI